MGVWDREAELVEENVDLLMRMMRSLEGWPSNDGRYLLYSLTLGVDKRGKIFTLPESAWTYKFNFRLNFNGTNLKIHRELLIETRNNNIPLPKYAEQVLYVSLNIMTQQYSRFQKYIDLKAS